MVAPRETEDNDYTFFFFRQGWGGGCIMGNVQMANKRIADK